MVELYTVSTMQTILHMAENLPDEPTLIFSEDKLTFALEQAITKARGAAFHIEVSTFSRFILQHVPPQKVLSGQGAVLKIASILAKHKEQLQYLGKNPIAYAKVIFNTLVQLRACDIQVDDLLQAIQVKSALQYKLNDLAFIYKIYLQYIEENALTDDNILMALFPEALKLADVKDKHILFIGHAAFTKQGERAIAASAQTAKKVTGILIGGDLPFYCNHAIESFKQSVPAVRERKIVEQSHPTARHLLANITGVNGTKLKTDSIYFYEAEDREQEVIAVAKAIKRRVAEGARYNSCAVYIGNLEKYAKSVKRVFRYYSIPYFLDSKADASKHPLALFIIHFLNLAAEFYDPDTVDNFLANYYCNIDNALKESYRNYLKVYANYRGGFQRPLKQLASDNIYADKLAAFTEIQQSILPYIDKMQKRQTGATFCQNLLHFLQEQMVEERTNLLAETFDGVDRAFIVNGAKKIMQFLDEIEQILQEDSFSIEEFVALVKQSLQSLEDITFLPQRIDEVYVGELAESRGQPKKFVFALGLTSDVPSQQMDTGLISDRDIDCLQPYQIKINPKIKDINKRLRERVILNLASFTKTLFFSYPKTSDGNTMQCSPFVERLFEIFTVQHLDFVDALETVEYHPTMRNLLVQLEAYRCKQSNALQQIQQVASFMHTQSSQLKRYLDMPSYEEIPPAKRIENAHILLLSKGAISASFIEQHYTCPYKNFLERGLKLTQEVNGIVDARDIGNLVHTVLENISLKMQQIDKDKLPQLLPVLQKEIEELTMQQLNASNFQYLTETEEERYKRAVCKEITAYLLAAVVQTLKASGFNIVSVEKPFEIALQNCKLKGAIDRVDRERETGAIRVIDYKTGTQEIKKTDYFAGKKVQLPLYLYAEHKAGESIENSSYFAAKIEYTEYGEKASFEKQMFASKGEDATLDKQAYIAYAVALTERCYKEVMQGSLPPSPYEESCNICKYGGICHYSVQFGVRTVAKVNKQDIANLMKGEMDNA